MEWSPEANYVCILCSEVSFPTASCPLQLLHSYIAKVKKLQWPESRETLESKDTKIGLDGTLNKSGSLSTWTTKKNKQSTPNCVWLIVQSEVCGWNCRARCKKQTIFGWKLQYTMSSSNNFIIAEQQPNFCKLLQNYIKISWIINTNALPLVQWHTGASE